MPAEKLKVTEMKERTIAIVGAAGMLGHALRARFPDAICFDAVVPEHTHISQIDIADKENLKQKLSVLRAGDYVINAAAYTDVDAVELEENRKRSYGCNVQGPINLSMFMRETGIKVLHMSTAFVFDGFNAPYRENDDPKPQNRYGKQKFWSESSITNEGGIVLRTDNLYGPQGKNVVDRLVERIQSNQSIPVVIDQIGSPTLTTTLAEIIHQVMEQWEQHPEMAGQIYHATSRNGCSRAELAQHIIGFLKAPCRIEFMTTEDYNAQYRKGKITARRPRDCRLNTEKLNGLSVITPEWRTDLEAYFRQEYKKKRTSLSNQATGTS